MTDLRRFRVTYTLNYTGGWGIIDASEILEAETLLLAINIAADTAKENDWSVRSVEEIDDGT